MVGDWDAHELFDRRPVRIVTGNREIEHRWSVSPHRSTDLLALRLGAYQANGHRRSSDRLDRTDDTGSADVVRSEPMLSTFESAPPETLRDLLDCGSRCPVIVCDSFYSRHKGRFFAFWLGLIFLRELVLSS